MKDKKQCIFYVKFRRKNLENQLNSMMKNTDELNKSTVEKK